MNREEFRAALRRLEGDDEAVLGLVRKVVVEARREAPDDKITEVEEWAALIALSIQLRRGVSGQSG